MATRRRPGSRASQKKEGVGRDEVGQVKFPSFFASSFRLLYHLVWTTALFSIVKQDIEFVGSLSINLALRIQPPFTLHSPISPCYFLDLHDYARYR